MSYFYYQKKADAFIKTKARRRKDKTIVIYMMGKSITHQLYKIII